MRAAASLTIAVLSLAPSVVAQDPRTQGPEKQDPKPLEGTTPAEEIPIPSDTEGRAVIDLELNHALSLGRRNNISLQADSLTPLQAAETLRIEEAFFEPEFFGDVRVARSDSPSRNTFQPSIAREELDGSLGLRSNVITGGLFELAFEPGKLRQSAESLANFPPRQFSSTMRATLTQPLLRGAWSDFNLANVEASRVRYLASVSRFQRQVQDTLLQVVEAYWELTFAREDYRVLFQALELAQEQLRITEERIRVRELAERDRVADEAEVARRKEELIRAENVIRDREDALRELLFDDADGSLWNRNLRPASPIVSDQGLPVGTWQSYARIALENRPDVVALRHDVQVAVFDLEVAQRNILPQLDLVGSYSSSGIRETTLADAVGDTTSLDFPAWSLQLQFSVPIGNSAARAARDRADLALEQSQRILYANEQSVQREVRDALRQLRTLGESIRAAEESVRLAETLLDTERERLKVGRTTIFEVQQRNQELRESRRQLLRNQLDYRIAESRFMHAQGLLEVPEER